MATALLNELIEREDLRDVPLDRDRVIRNRYREVMPILVTMVVAVAAWFIPAEATYLFLLFFASDVPGRIATRRPEHQAEHGPRSALPAPRVAVETASVETASIEAAVAVVLAAILAAVVLAIVLAAVVLAVTAVVVVPVSAEKAASAQEASQRFRGQNAAADTESEPAGSGEEALAA